MVFNQTVTVVFLQYVFPPRRTVCIIMISCRYLILISAWKELVPIISFNVQELNGNINRFFVVGRKILEFCSYFRGTCTIKFVFLSIGNLNNFWTYIHGSISQPRRSHLSYNLYEINKLNFLKTIQLKVPY